MKKAIDIHDIDTKLDNARKLIAKANPISKRNSDMIFKFENFCYGSIGKKRITKYVLSLKKLAEWLDKDFDKVT